MKHKILFYACIFISILVLCHLLIIGISFDSQIIIGEFSNENISSISKTSLIFYISALMVFALLVIIPNYIKEKKVNENLFIAYLILEIVLNILPYFYN